MAHPEQRLRTRAIGLGHLRAFEAVARHLSFRAAIGDGPDPDTLDHLD